MKLHYSVVPYFEVVVLGVLIIKSWWFNCSVITVKTVCIYFIELFKNFSTIIETQFGFKVGLSTNVCTEVLKETINFFAIMVVISAFSH